MKKTLSIHLGRQLFTIEEDAYELLKDYLKKLELSFAEEEGSREIMEDIEMRCAELLQARLADNHSLVVSILDIRAIIASLGEPEMISEETDTRQNSENKYKEQENVRGRRLFRDMENATLGGVCSGISAYVNVDPVVIRILFVISLFLGFGFPLYIILWIVIPDAKTPSDRLQLHGKPVTIESLKEEISKTAASKKDDLKNAAERLRNNAYVSERLRFFIKVISKIIGLGMLGFSSLFLIGFTLTVTGVLDVFPVTGDKEYATLYEYLGLFIPGNKALSLMWNSILIMGIAAPLIGIILGIRILIQKKSRFFTYSLIILPILFVTGIFMAIIASIQIARDFEVEKEFENNHLVLDSKILEIEVAPEYVNNKKVTNSSGIDFFHIEKGFISTSDIHIKTIPSADTLFHIHQKFSANGVDGKSAVKRSMRISHKIELTGNKLLISPDYKYPLKDGIRGQEVEIVIEVPVGKGLKVNEIPMHRPNEEHNGIISGHRIEFWEDHDSVIIY